MPRRGECIYKRKDGRWEARYVKTIGADGHKHYGSVYAHSYREVKDKRQWIMNRPVSHAQAPSALRVADLMSRWLRHIQGHVRPATHCKYRKMSDNHILPALGTMLLSQITRGDLEQFARVCLTTGRVGGGALSFRTVNDILIILMQAFSFAQEEYGMTLPKVRLWKEEKKQARVLSIPEQDRLVAYLLKDMDLVKFAVLLALYTGIRVGELCALQWGDFTDDCIGVTKTVQRLSQPGGHSTIVVGPPKSDASRRIIPIPPALLPYVEQFRQEDEAAVLKTSRRAYAEPRNVQLWFGKIAEDCGLEGVTVHTLRHTFATRCIEAGIDPKTLSELLGHSDVKTTLNRYVHSSFEHKRASMEKLTLARVE